LSPATPADNRRVEKFVAVVICAVLVLPAGAAASSGADALLPKASRLSGLHPRHRVPTATLVATRYDAVLRQAARRDYPRRLREIDARLYALLGLTPHTEPAQLLPRRTSAAWYDPALRKLLLRRARPPAPARVINELVRALVDQNFGLQRIASLRSRNRDAALAAQGIVDGTAALASGVRAPILRGPPLERFLELDSATGLGPGRALAAKLRYLGGARALATALRTFPQTTEQLLHVDKFLERERAVPVQLPLRIGTVQLVASETFGELEVRNLLRAYGLAGAGAVAAGWGGGRLALYRSSASTYTAALELRWDSVPDAEQWRDTVPRFAAAAFGVTAKHDCPPLDGCWSAANELAAGATGVRTVFAAGPDADHVAAALLT
jgi:hypothetical protein